MTTDHPQHSTNRRTAAAAALQPPPQQQQERIATLLRTAAATLQNMGRRSAVPQAAELTTQHGEAA